MADPTRTTDPPAVTRSLTDDGVGAVIAPPTDPGRYTLGAEIARGGMGVVYRATDTALGREVAVKVLQDKYAPESGTARRFFDEARIAAQLQHPGIPPVHDLGTLPDGRPFLAMKLIKGDTLDDLLKHRTDATADRGRFVAAFEQVCHAVAYAHAHGVIHRDLKPANVMVGAFGEVQVMDWGLAKVLASRDREGAGGDPDATAAVGTAIRSLRDSDGSETQAGSILGTPAFMPPEQAVGAVGKIDTRSDVFGLGAILAVVLTGQPPFASGSAETTRVRAAQADVADCFARLDGCGADPELVALCKRCLSPKAADRPADAGEVAKAVAALRQAADERARQAEMDRVTAELQAREQRKRRRVQQALGGLVVAVIASGVGVGWWADRQATERRSEAAERERVESERTGRNTEAVAALLGQCEEAIRNGDAAKADVALEAAEKRTADGGTDTLTDRLSRCRADLDMLRVVEAAERFEWTSVDGDFPTWEQLAVRYREAFVGFGLDPERVAPAGASRRVSESAARDRLVAALDIWLLGEQSDWVRDVLRAVDPDPFRDAVRDAALAEKDGSLVVLAFQPAALKQSPAFASALGQSARIDSDRRLQILTEGIRRRPDDLGLLMALGRTASAANDPAAALRWYQAAVAVAPQNPAVHLRLGWTKQELQDADGAEQCYREAVRLGPADSSFRYTLGTLLLARGTIDPTAGFLAEGEDHLRAALRAKPDEPRHLCNLAHLLRERGEYAEALRLMKQGHELGTREKDWEYTSADWVKECERLAKLEQKWAAVAAGKAKAAGSSELLEFARVSRAKRRYAEAARFYQQGLEDRFTFDGNAIIRDNVAAAEVAALAAGGEGVEPPAAADRAAFRELARGWFDEMLLPLRLMVGVPAARANIHAWTSGWLAAPALRSVREPEHLAQLPPAEAKAWDKFWTEIRGFHARTAPREVLPPPRKAR